MKKPLSVLAIAILISVQLITPVSRLYADDGTSSETPPPVSAADTSAATPTPDTSTPTPPPTAPADSSAAVPPPTAPADSSAGDETTSAPPAIDTTTESSSTPSLPPPTSAGGDSSAGIPDGATSTLPITATSTASSNDASTTPSDPSVDASLSNSATTTSTTISDASTGGNTASSTTAAGITTGDAVATANVVNVVNVNLFNSDALVTFLNNLSSGNSNINLDNSAFEHDGFVGCGCSTSISTSTGSSDSIDATNTATIGNTTIVRASTGDNTANGGAAGISTGNAYAAANIATLANATLVDSHYVMLVLNSFGSLGGDVVLPVTSFWEDFLNSAFPSLSDLSSPANVSANNTADVSTNATTSAETGGNMASSTDGSAIQTGSAQSTSNTINDVNQTHIGGATVDIIFHIFGNWSGQTFNLPAGFRAVQTTDGLEIMASNANASAIRQGELALSGTNAASIQNNLSVSASTGNNAVTGSTTGISTGNAYAASNSITVANVTSISHNWLSAIVNIFGDWNGNISFGQPDLWVGIRAESADTVTPGGPITYHYTIKNKGDAPAHNVRLVQTFGSASIQADSANDGSWDLGTLAPGESREIDEPARAVITPWSGMESVSNTVQASETESDANSNDNSDVISIVVGQPSIGGGYGTPEALPHFRITKTVDAASAIAASSTVNYTIHLINDGGAATHAIVSDQIADQNGNVIHNENWDLGPVKANEDITLTYEAFFSASSTPGIYNNNAQVFSADGQFGSSTIATAAVTIGTTVGQGGGSSGSSSSFGTLVSHSSSGSGFVSTKPYTVDRAPIFSFAGPSAPLPPAGGGPIGNQGLVASVGAATTSPYAWSLYLLVLTAGGWYLVSKRRAFGWGIVEGKK